MGLLESVKSLWTSLTQQFYSLSTLQKTAVVVVVGASAHLCIKKFFWCQKLPTVSYPLSAKLPSFGKKTHIVLMELRRDYGDLFKIQTGSIQTVVISGELIRKALTEHGDKFSGRPQLSQNLTPQNGLTTLTFGKFDKSWIVHKQIATDVLTSFSSDKKTLVQDIIQDEVKTLLKEFQDQNNIPFSPDGNIRMAVASVIFQICYGKRQKIRSDRDFCEYIKLNGHSSNVRNSTNTVPRSCNTTQKRIHDYKTFLQHGKTLRHRLIKDHINSYKDGHIRDVADYLIKTTKSLNEDEKRKGMTGDRILGTVGDLFAGGLDTVHSIMTWSILLLTVYNTVQVKVQEELDCIVGRTKFPTLEDSHRLPYLQATIHELFRFVCVTPLSIPHSITGDVTLAGYTLRKDTGVFVNLYSLSHDPEIWEEPTSFRPERFLTDSGLLDTSLVERFLPFSVGNRRCPGESLARAEIFLLLSGLLHKCSFIRARDVPSYSLQSATGASQKPLPYKIEVHLRM